MAVCDKYSCYFYLNSKQKPMTKTNFMCMLIKVISEFNDVYKRNRFPLLSIKKRIKAMQDNIHSIVQCLISRQDLIYQSIEKKIWDSNKLFRGVLENIIVIFFYLLSMKKKKFCFLLKLTENELKS